MYSPIIDNPNKIGTKRLKLAVCKTLLEATELRRNYITKNFSKNQILATKNKEDAIESVSIEKLRESLNNKSLF